MSISSPVFKDSQQTTNQAYKAILFTRLTVFASNMVDVGTAAATAETAESEDSVSATATAATEWEDVSCATCNKIADAATKLRACTNRKTVDYCSRECQRADWKEHKKVWGFIPTGKSRNSTGTRRPTDATSNRHGHITNTARSANSPLLQGRPEAEVYSLLTDSYRLRIEDEYTFTGDVDVDSLYGGGNPVKGFRRYLRKAESKRRPLTVVVVRGHEGRMCESRRSRAGVERLALCCGEERYRRALRHSYDADAAAHAGRPGGGEQCDEHLLIERCLASDGKGS